jgi:hypothetical protein
MQLTELPADAPVDRSTIDRINSERTIPLSRYQEESAESRFEYLEGLAQDSNLSIHDVIFIADMLTSEEDFDGLPMHIEEAGFF